MSDKADYREVQAPEHHTLMQRAADEWNNVCIVGNTNHRDEGNGMER